MPDQTLDAAKELSVDSWEPGPYYVMGIYQLGSETGTVNQ